MNNSHNRIAAIYARVSGEQQAKAETIASQVAALEEQVAKDDFVLESQMRFLDDGYTGATLIRPALERLRDMAATGVIDRIYVHNPDRLARKYAYQVLLLDEFSRCGVEVFFLNHPLGRPRVNTPSDATPIIAALAPMPIGLAVSASVTTNRFAPIYWMRSCGKTCVRSWRIHSGSNASISAD